MGWRSRRRRERELAEELRSHLRMAVEERMSRGEPYAEALAAARRELGSEVLVAEVTREMWPGARWSGVVKEVGIALRMLRRTPGFAAAAVVCIALGMGATLTIFSTIHSVLLRPLPYAHEAELLSVRATQAELDGIGGTLAQEALDTWRGASSLAEVGTWRATSVDLTGHEDLPERVTAAAVSANLLPLLGVAPALGRGLDATDELPGSPAAILLSHELWQRRYGADPSIPGRTVLVDGRPHEVRGVMPAGFSFPEGAVAWRPLIVPQLPPDILFYDGVLARIAPGAGVSQAQAEFDARTRGFAGGYAGWRFELLPLREHLLGGLRRPLLIFQGAALLVLLLACANVAALMLARSAARQRELATRAALGADGVRLGRHVLVECLTLAVIGGAAGIWLAVLGLRLLTLAFPAGVPSYIELSMHAPALLFAGAVTLVIAVAFGVVPAVRAGRTRASAALVGAGRAGPASRAHVRALAGLVAFQVAASVILLSGAALLTRTYFALQESLGFVPDGVLAVGISLPQQRYADADRRAAFHDELQRQLRGIPGVTAASASVSAVPLDEGVTSGLWAFRSEGEPAPRANEELRAAGQLIEPGYLAALGVPLLRGRDLDDADRTAGEMSVLVNETFARRYFPDGDATGRRIIIEPAPGAGMAPARIVGVVGDFRHRPPPAEIPPALFALQPRGTARQTIVLRTRLADPAVLAPEVRRRVHDLDPALVIGTLQTQSGIVERTFWRQRLQRNVIVIFAALAVLLATFGTYGVVSYTVAQRTSELGVRLALGASKRSVLLHVMARAARLAVIGVCVGVAATLAFARVLTGLLYGVHATDPITLAVAAGGVLGIAIAAAVAPALRAARLDPQVAIREA